MKKNLVVTFFLLMSLSLFSQTEHLYVNGPYHVGTDIGFSVNGYVPIGFHFGSYNTKFQYGFTVGVPVNRGVKGEHYPTINWDEYPEDIVSEGDYYTPFTIDIGYNVYGGIIIGGGLGIATQTVYRNMFDEFHILGYNGSYYLTAKGDPSVEYKGFITYYFPTESDKFGSTFFKASYSHIMGPGISFGITF